jgi:AcrR family transcriptional regulator
MKRKQLIDTGKDLFWKYGIRRVTVEEICREADVSKMTFYKHFKNKNELVKTIIYQITEEALEKYRLLMEKDIPFEEKVRETSRMKYEGTDQMSQEFLNDYIPDAEPEMLEFVYQRMQQAMGLIMEDYRKAQQRGDIRQNIKIEFILYFLNKMIELMGDKELEKMYGSPQEMIMELVNFFFYGIMPRKS